MKNEYEKQDKRQNGLVEVFAAKGGRGFITAVTGFGKTVLGMKVVNRMHQRVPTRRCHVVVPTTHLRDQWEEEVRKFEVQHTEVYVVNSYVDMINDGRLQLPDLFILDEGHNYASEDAAKHGQVFDFAEGKFILVLTATPKGKMVQFLQERNIPYIGHVSEEEAEREHYIAKKYVYNWALPMPERLIEEYDKYSRMIKNNMAIFDSDYTKAMLCLSAKGADTIREVAKQMQVPEAEVKKYANLLNWAVNQRKLLLYEAQEKIECVKQLLAKFPVKTISFSQSTVFADNLVAAIGYQARSLHSKKATEYRVGTKVVARAIQKKGRQKGKKDTYFVDLATGVEYTPEQAAVKYKGAKKIGKERLNREAKELFENPDSGVLLLSTAESLDEGYNNKKVLAGYKTSGTSVGLQRVQRDGRITRKDGEKEALIVNIYFEGTKDEDWLRSSQERAEVKTVRSIDEIEFDFSVPQTELDFKK